MKTETSISKKAKIGKNVIIWPNSQIREGVVIGNNCIIGRNVYIDHDVVIGSNVKIQNNALIYFRTIIENNVFIGPAVCLINDKYPRATNDKGKLKAAKDWHQGTIFIKKGASVGAGVIVLPDVEVGTYSMVGAGSVITHSIPNYSKVIGNPAEIVGYVCKFGHNIRLEDQKKKRLFCKTCKSYYLIK